MRCRTLRVFSSVVPGALAVTLVAALPSHAGPIAVAGYAYDFSQTDSIGGTTTIHSFATDPSNALLTDGDLGSLSLVPFGIQDVAFPNGTWVGFTNHGFGDAYQPRVILDLGGTFDVGEVKLSYLIEDESSVYAPETYYNRDEATGEIIGINQNAMVVQTSTDGVNFTEVAVDNDFTLRADVLGTGALSQETKTVSFGGVSATHLAVELHTPWSFIFLSEVRVAEGVVGGVTGDFNASGQVEQGDLDLVLQNWGDDTAVTGIPAGWTNDNTNLGQIEQTELDRVLQNWGGTSAPDFSGSAVPEPGTIGLLGLGAMGLLFRKQAPRC